MVFNVGWATMGPIAAGLVITFGSYWGYAYAFTITASLYIVSSTYYYFIFGRRKLAEEIPKKPAKSGRLEQNETSID
jgi:hypothetical protein